MPKITKIRRTPIWWIILGSLIILLSGGIVFFVWFPYFNVEQRLKPSLEPQSFTRAQEKINERLIIKREELQDYITNFSCSTADNIQNHRPQIFSPHGLTSSEQDDLLSKLKNSVVMITTNKGTGSGFFISDEYIITNEHVVGLAQQVKVYNAEILPKPITGDVIEVERGRNNGRDYALIKVNSVTQSQHLSYAKTATTLDFVAAAGYPGIYQGIENTKKPKLIIRSGELIDFFNQSEGLDLIAHTAEIFPGNSGGPLVDKCGRLIGINTFITWTSIIGTKPNSPIEKFNFALNAGDLQNYLATKGIQLTLDSNTCDNNYSDI